jgi:Kazal-type serine protease inhibitor domain
MKRRALILMFAMTFLIPPAAALLGCATEEIIIAKRVGPGAGSPTCTSNAECTAFEICTKASCGEPTGLCEPREATCTRTFAPSCGCDGVTYLNDCLRKASGVPLRKPGECGREASRCGRDKPPCSADAFCARLVNGPECGPQEAEGTCWIIPTSCDPANGGDDAWTPCGPPEKKCTDTCSAIRSEQPHVRRSRCR